VGALKLGDPVDAEPVGVAGFPVTGIGPGIRFLPMRTRAASHGAASALDAPTMAAATTPPPRKITSRSEWTLVAFTLVAQLLVGLVLGAARSGGRIHVVPLLGMGALAMAVSTLHLGRPMRAWRAALNLRRSWLSREVVSWSLFLGLAGVAFAIEPWPAGRWAAGLVGAMCLTCIDRVYVVMARRDRARMDDVSALSAGVLLGAASAGMVWVATLVAAWRIGASVTRRTIALGSPAGAAWLLAGRVGCALAGVALLWSGGAPPALALAAFVAGDILDRVSFYDALDIVSPRTQVLHDTPDGPQHGSALQQRPPSRPIRGRSWMTI
jgi:hypothetical protein